MNDRQKEEGGREGGREDGEGARVGFGVRYSVFPLLLRLCPRMPPSVDRERWFTAGISAARAEANRLAHRRFCAP